MDYDEALETVDGKGIERRGFEFEFLCMPPVSFLYHPFFIDKLILVE